MATPSPAVHPRRHDDRTGLAAAEAPRITHEIQRFELEALRVIQLAVRPRPEPAVALEPARSAPVAVTIEVPHDAPRDITLSDDGAARWSVATSYRGATITAAVA
jgi:hypothetical protein